MVDALSSTDLRQAAATVLPHWSDPVVLPFLLPRLDQAKGDAKGRIAEWVATSVTPAHAGPLVKLIAAYRDVKDVANGLKGGVKHLITRYPVVGPIDLLGCGQPAMRTLATKALKAGGKDVDPDDARQVRDERAKATQPRLVFVQVGTIQRDTVADIAKAVAASPLDKTLALNVEVDRKALTLKTAGPLAIDARPLLAQLARRKFQDHRAVRVIGITRSPLMAPGLQTAMAPLRPDGAVLVSLAGLGRDRETAVHLGRRLTLHALARSFAIPPSSVPACPANPLYEPGDLATRSLRLSAPSEAALATTWAVETDAAAFLYGRVGKQLAAAARRTPSKAALAQAAYYYERDLDTTAAIAQWRAYHALEKDATLKALVQKRIDLLALSQKWLADRGVAPGPTLKRPTRQP